MFIAPAQPAAVRDVKPLGACVLSYWAEDALERVGGAAKSRGYNAPASNAKALVLVLIMQVDSKC